MKAPTLLFLALTFIAFSCDDDEKRNTVVVNEPNTISFLRWPASRPDVIYYCALDRVKQYSFTEKTSREIHIATDIVMDMWSSDDGSVLYLAKQQTRQGILNVVERVDVATGSVTTELDSIEGTSRWGEMAWELVHNNRHIAMYKMKSGFVVHDVVDKAEHSFGNVPEIWSNTGAVLRLRDHQVYDADSKKTVLLETEELRNQYKPYLSGRSAYKATVNFHEPVVITEWLSGKVVATIPVNNEIPPSFEISLSGKYIAYTDYVCETSCVYEVKLLELATGETQLIATVDGNEARPTDLKFSPDEHKLVFAVGVKIQLHEIPN